VTAAEPPNASWSILGAQWFESRVFSPALKHDGPIQSTVHNARLPWCGSVTVCAVKARGWHGDSARVKDWDLSGPFRRYLLLRDWSQATLNLDTTAIATTIHGLGCPVPHEVDDVSPFIAGVSPRD
jgi:hypothetical protein